MLKMKDQHDPVANITNPIRTRYDHPQPTISNTVHCTLTIPIPIRTRSDPAFTFPFTDRRDLYNIVYILLATYN